MQLLKRKRVLGAVLVVVFVAAFAAIGLAARGVKSTATSTSGSSSGFVPSANWYWTMAVAPTNPEELVVGTSSGLYRSVDGGKSWQATGPAGVDATSLVDVGDAILLGGVTGGGPSPISHDTSTNTRIVTSGKPLFAESTDGGSSWTVLHPSGVPDSAVQALAVDPTESSMVYLLTNTGALYRSTNSGRTFSLDASKLATPPWALTISKSHAIVAGNMDNGSYVCSSASSCTKTGFHDTSGGQMVMEYAVAPTDLTRVLMTAYGIEMSSDGGKTWHVVLRDKGVMFGPIAFAPSSPEIAYAVGFDGSVWRTSNAGESWNEVS